MFDVINFWGFNCGFSFFRDFIQMKCFKLLFFKSSLIMTYWHKKELFFCYRKKNQFSTTKHKSVTPSDKTQMNEKKIRISNCIKQREWDFHVGFQIWPHSCCVNLYNLPQNAIQLVASRGIVHHCKRRISTNNIQPQWGYGLFFFSSSFLFRRSFIHSSRCLHFSLRSRIFLLLLLFLLWQILLNFSLPLRLRDAKLLI